MTAERAGKAGTTYRTYWNAPPPKHRSSIPPRSRALKILEITNVDFSLRHFLLPLMRGMKARGHDVIGIAAEGPLLASARAEGFRIIPVPFVRSLSPIGNLRAFRALRAVMRAERPDLIHAHSPIAGFLARLAAWSLGLPKIAYTSHGYIFNQRTSLARRGLSFALEWLGGRMTDIYLTVSTEDAEDARRFRIASNAIAILPTPPEAPVTRISPWSGVTPCFAIAITASIDV